MGERGDVPSRFWWGDLEESDNLENLGVHGRIILKLCFKNWEGARTGLIWLRIRKCGGLL